MNIQHKESILLAIAQNAKENSRLETDVRLQTYLSAFFHDWLTGMSGPLSVPFGTAAIWSSNRTQKVLWGCLAVIAALFGSYRVWRKGRISLNDQIQSLTVAKDREIARRNPQIEILSRKPYPEDLERIARQVLQFQMTLEGRHVLRQLMIHEAVEIGTLSLPEIPQDRQYAQIEIAMRNGLLKHREDRQGALLRTYWVINPQFRQVLENVLYEGGMLN